MIVNETDSMGIELDPQYVNEYVIVLTVDDVIGGLNICVWGLEDVASNDHAE